METSANDYTPQEDLMMWKLKEIRKQISNLNLSPVELNNRANKIILKYKLNCKRLEITNV
ncbi:MAG: hypothetical protein KBF93_01885 [Leptospiraceae bacterium]|nr:hypothetical protein [Leptospiraceae bacterium]